MRFSGVLRCTLPLFQRCSNEAVVGSPWASVVIKPPREVLSANDCAGSRLWMGLFMSVIFLASGYSGRHAGQLSLQDRCALSVSIESAPSVIKGHSALQSQ